MSTLNPNAEAWSPGGNVFSLPPAVAADSTAKEATNRDTSGFPVTTLNSLHSTASPYEPTGAISARKNPSESPSTLGQKDIDPTTGLQVQFDPETETFYLKEPKDPQQALDAYFKMSNERGSSAECEYEEVEGYDQGDMVLDENGVPVHYADYMAAAGYDITGGDASGAVPPPPAYGVMDENIASQDWEALVMQNLAEQRKILEAECRLVEEQNDPPIKGFGAVGDGDGSTEGKLKTPPLKGTDVKPRLAGLKGANIPPLTSAGNHRWHKLTKGQQRRVQLQKGAFESFANALLHSVSPFMAPLRARCGSSLPHIKVDQRFGKLGQPQTAVAQFIVAPLVVNYRPRHFHDVTPGDLMEFHYDFSQVVKQLQSANAILFSYGPTWKRYAIPYCFLSCKEYRKEVLALCQDEIPNSKGDAIYEDDVLKDISEIVFAVEELQPLTRMSFVEAMRRRINLVPLYDVFESIFRPIGDYQIIVRQLHQAPSQYIVKTSQSVLGARTELLVILDEPELWDQLEDVGNGFVSGTAMLITPGATETPVEQAPAAPPKKTVVPASSPLAPASNETIPLIPVVVSVCCIALTLGIVLGFRRQN